MSLGAPSTNQGLVLPAIPSGISRTDFSAPSTSEADDWTFAADCEVDPDEPDAEPEIELGRTAACPPAWVPLQLKLHNLPNHSATSAEEEAKAVLKKLDTIKVRDLPPFPTDRFIVKPGDISSRGFQRSARIFVDPIYIGRDSRVHQVTQALFKLLAVNDDKPVRWSSCRGNDRITTMHFELFLTQESKSKSVPVITLTEAAEAAVGVFRSLGYAFCKPWAVTVDTFTNTARGFIADYNPNHVDHLISLDTLGWSRPSQNGGYHIRFRRYARLLLPSSGTTIATYIADDDRRPDALRPEVQEFVEQWNTENSSAESVSNYRTSDDGMWYLCDPSHPDLAFWLQFRPLSTGYYFDYAFNVNADITNFDKSKIIAARDRKALQILQTETP